MQTEFIYIYAGVSLIIILLVYIAYLSWKTKRMIQNEVNQVENKIY